MTATIGGDIYVFNNETYNYLFGEAKETSITVVGNKNLPSVKVWDYISVNSSDEWTAGEDWDIEVDGGVMKSRLKQLLLREGKYTNSFKRNILHPNGAVDAGLINNGERLRGKTISVVLRNSATDKVTISTVTISGTLSEKII